MSATNSTLNYQLPQFIATDKPAWLTDFNGAMQDIDTAIKEAKTAGDNAQTTANTNATNIQTLDGTVTSQGTAIGTLTTSVAGNTGSINTINSLIGNGTPTTTDKTIIGAINEVNAKDAADIDFDNTGTSLVATNVEAAIKEVAAGSGVTVSADDVTYSNTASGLSATNVQDAIDELASASPSGGADLNFVTSGSATVTSSAGTVDPSGTDVKYLLNTDASIGKIYGGVELTSVTLTGGNWETVATISISDLPSIAESYNIFLGFIQARTGSTAWTTLKARLKFNTNKTVDLQVYTSATSLYSIEATLTPCIYILKDLGD